MKTTIWLTSQYHEGLTSKGIGAILLWFKEPDSYASVSYTKKGLNDLGGRLPSGVESIEIHQYQRAVGIHRYKPTGFWCIPYEYYMGLPPHHSKELENLLKSCSTVINDWFFYAVISGREKQKFLKMLSSILEEKDSQPEQECFSLKNFLNEKKKKNNQFIDTVGLMVIRGILGNDLAGWYDYYSTTFKPGLEPEVFRHMVNPAMGRKLRWPLTDDRHESRYKLAIDIEIGLKENPYSRKIWVVYSGNRKLETFGAQTVRVSFKKAYAAWNRNGHSLNWFPLPIQQEIIEVLKKKRPHWKEAIEFPLYIKPA